MYGVPPDLPLQGFVGKECCQIALGMCEIQFNFGDGHNLSVEGPWELRNASGERIDCSRVHSDRDAYCVHKLLGSPVERFLIDAPKSFTLIFQNGHALTVYDENIPYESFSIQPGDI